MKKASITETKNRLSALLDEVRQGETVLIVDRGRPIARLESVLTEPSGDEGGRLARLERQGLLRRASSRPPRSLVEQPGPRLDGEGTLVDLLVEEREQSR